MYCYFFTISKVNNNVPTDCEIQIEALWELNYLLSVYISSYTKLMHMQMNVNAYIYYRCRATIKKKRKRKKILKKINCSRYGMHGKALSDIPKF